MKLLPGQLYRISLYFPYKKLFMCMLDKNQALIELEALHDNDIIMYIGTNASLSGCYEFLHKGKKISSVKGNRVNILRCLKEISDE